MSKYNYQWPTITWSDLYIFNKRHIWPHFQQKWKQLWYMSCWRSCCSIFSEPAWQQTICCWHSWSTSSHCTSPCWCSWSNVEEVLYFRDKIVIGPAPPHYLHTIDLSIISGKFWETCSKQFSLYSLWTRDFTLEIGRNFSTELGMQLGNINHSFVSASHWCETWWGVKLKCIYLLSCWKLKYSLFYFTLSIFWKLNLVQQNIVFVFSSSVTNKVKRV